MVELLPFVWSDVRPTQGQREVLEEARLSGITSGLSVPVHGAMGEFSLISLASALPGAEFKKLMAEARHNLHLAAMHYHARVAELTAAAAGPVPTLTGREREVLTWTATGKTAWEISQILGIAEPTVVFHIENAKKKLGACSRSLAVVKAITLGLIAP